MEYICKKYSQMIEITINRVEGDYGFEGRDANGHTVRMDTSLEGGGTDAGIRPMQMLLMGLGGCSGIDIVSILKKQKQPIEGISMKIEGEREPGKEPSLWQDIKIVFELKGALDPQKARRACELSMEKYCSVGATLRKAGANISWDLRIV